MIIRKNYEIKLSCSYNIKFDLVQRGILQFVTNLKYFIEKLIQKRRQNFDNSFDKFPMI